MPTTTRCLNPSAANERIGGIPIIHYLDFQSRGRGQAVRLLFEDAQISYDDVRYDFSEAKRKEFAKLNPAQTLPIIELNRKILTQSYAILRHFARRLGKYEGKTEEEVYWTDAVCDIVADWRTLFVHAAFSDDPKETYPKHQQTDRNRFLLALETHLKTHDLSRSGPFVLGDEVSYADIVLYQMCHDEELTQDDREGLREYTRLRQLVDAMEERPNIKAFLESERYRG